MDTFQDLLSEERGALEENPFADPFISRHGSPNPWLPRSSSTPIDAGDDILPNTGTAHQPAEIREECPLADDTASRELFPSTDLTDSAHLFLSPSCRESIEPPVPEIQKSLSSDLIIPEIESLGVNINHSNFLNVESTYCLPETQLDRGPSKCLGIATDEEPPPRLNPSLSSSQCLTSIVPATSFNKEVDRVVFQTQHNIWNKPPDDESDDDKPIGRKFKLPENQEHFPPGLHLVTRIERDVHPVFVISVEDPQKVGDAIRSYTMYTVHTRTTSSHFQKSAFSVLRRYSDFLWLYETLSANNPGVIVPPVPEKNTFGRFDDQFVLQRRFALEKCIQKIANHPVLSEDSDFKMFLESDSFALDSKHRKAEIAHERGGVLSSIGQAVAGPRFYETDEWFDRKKLYFDGLEIQLRGLAKAIEAVAKQRLDISIAMGEFAEAVNELSCSLVDQQLSHSLAGLAEVEQKSQGLHTEQIEQDMIILTGTVDEYARLINSVRLAFGSRIRAYHTWKAAENDAFRAKHNHEKNRSQVRSDRVGYSLNQIADVERRAMDAKHEYDQVSKLVKLEVIRFEEERVQDFKNSLHAFLEGMISKQQKLITSWGCYQQNLLRRVGSGELNSGFAS